MKVYRSNRIEALCDALAGVVQTPAAGPLIPEPIVVHSRAMAVWLSLRLCERFGSWVGGRFPFPRRFIHDVLTTVLGSGAAGPDAWHAERLVWAVHAELPRHLGRPEFAPLRRYLQQDPREHGRFELARRIAEAFDQYAVFRPDLVMGWEHGRDDHWQAELWRSLRDRIGDRHPANLARELVATLQGGAPRGVELPPRVCVFGISALPPLFVRMFSALSSHVPVHLFVLSPSREYWAEIQSQREALRAARRDPQRVAAPALDEGNPLLASFGAVGRDFQRVLETEVSYAEPGPDRYEDPPGTTMLARLQSDVLHLRHRRLGDDSPASLAPAPAPPLAIAAADASIRIHACHSPMREVEVLHDQLMALLHEDGYAPEEIGVLTPDMATYGPLVEAVFERTDRDDPRFIPYTIADRAPRRESPVLEALLRVFAMVGGRVTASSVLDLLSLDVVRRRFDITADDHDTVSEWVALSGIRWGIDAAHRAEHDQPRYDQNTWRFGLQRMLLGYALPGAGRVTFAGILPFDEIEGNDALVLGRFADLLHTLFAELDELARARSLPAWRTRIGQALDALVAVDPDNAWEHQQIRTALDELVEDAAAVGFEDEIDIETVVERLEHRVEQDRPARGFLAGGVTFCALLPMRTLPFSVVCLLGLGDGQFPRPSPRVGFDLIAAHPRPGDRSRRDDDRYLFLEAVLAARERLVATYVGQSITDNAALPPSVALSELLDVLSESFVVPGAEATAPAAERAAALRAHVVVRHPMQPFSGRYFGGDDDPRLFSYARAWEDGARAVAGRAQGVVTAPLLTGPLPATSEALRVTVDELVRYLSHPCAQLLKRRLGINLTDYGREHDDREPTELDNLEQWKVGDALLGLRMDAVDVARCRDLLVARGELPLGVLGLARFDALLDEVEPIVASAGALRRGGVARDLDVDLELDGARIVGRVGGTYDRAIIRTQFAKIGARHQLAAWIRHLVVAAATDEPRPTAIIGKPDRAGGAQMCQLRPVEEARALLADLVEVYRIARREPVLLFPRASCAYAETLPKGEVEALAAARRAWTDRFVPEGADPHVRRLFGDADPLVAGYSPFDEPLAAGDFATVAVRVFGPLVAHRSEH